MKSLSRSDVFIAMVLSYLLSSGLLRLENGRGRAFLHLLLKIGTLSSVSEVICRFEEVTVRVLVLLTILATMRTIVIVDYLCLDGLERHVVHVELPLVVALLLLIT